MAHTIRDRKKLIDRVRRIRGQLDAVERSLSDERTCGDTLQLIAACRGAIHGLMAEVLEGHIRDHVMVPGADPESPQSQGAQELIDVVRAYLK